MSMENQEYQPKFEERQLFPQPGVPGFFPPGQPPGPPPRPPGQQPGIPPRPPGQPPGLAPFPPGQFPPFIGGPTAPPPAFTPPRPDFGIAAVDPGAIRGCLFRFTFIWLRTGAAFWAFPIFVGRTSLAGFRWTGFNWVYFGIDLRYIDFFQCY